MSSNEPHIHSLGPGRTVDTGDQLSSVVILGLAVAGAAYDGVGIPACVASARAAARQVLAHLSRFDGRD